MHKNESCGIFIPEFYVPYITNLNIRDCSPKVNVMENGVLANALAPPPLRPLGGVVERRRKRCTLPLCITFISIVEISFYCLVLTLFSIGLTLFDGYPKLSEDGKVAKILRITIMGFAGVYVILAIVLLIGTRRKLRYLILIWIFGALILMAIEWIAVVVSVALLLNGAIFFISGGYGPLRLCFICLAVMYYQRLKYARTATRVLPVVEPMDHGDGYQMVNNASVIFNQPLGSDDSAQTIRLNFELSGSDQSLI